jgi:hypothetical protein
MKERSRWRKKRTKGKLWWGLEVKTKTKLTSTKFTVDNEYDL